MSYLAVDDFNNIVVDRGFIVNPSRSVHRALYTLRTLFSSSTVLLLPTLSRSFFFFYPSSL